MSAVDHIRYVVDAAGRVAAVQLSAELWEHVQSLVRSAAANLGEVPAPSAQAPEPLDAFAELLGYWDFSYAYTPDVRCPQCNACTDDWREGEPRPFRLLNANLGGLLVFRCKGCGATVRQKHFKDHRAVEFTAKH